MSANGITPIVLANEEGQTFAALGASFLVKTSGADSAGQWFVMMGAVPGKMPGPAPHFHKVSTEIFVVLEGEVTFHVDGQSRRVGPGGYAYIPPGTVHSFANDVDMPARYLGIVSPAAMEGYFRELMTRVQKGDWPPQDMADISALMARYDSFAPESA